MQSPGSTSSVILTSVARPPGSPSAIHPIAPSLAFPPPTRPADPHESHLTITCVDLQTFPRFKRTSPHKLLANASHPLGSSPSNSTMTSPAFVPLTPLAARSTFTRAAHCPAHPFSYLPRRTRCTLPRMSADTAASNKFSTISAGDANTLDYRLFYKSASGMPMSPWHDIPLWPDAGQQRVLNFVNEIPRGTQAKMEIAIDEAATPIKQDVKKGVLREYKYGPSLVNYGALPQTWENPAEMDLELGVQGDGDPLDVTEIGEKVMPFGAVYRVKLLGCLALLDEGEIDWKVIAINVDDPNAADMNDIEDVEKVMPGRVERVREWFRMYKTAEGKEENAYAYGGEAKGAEFTMQVVRDAHESWRRLQNGEIENTDGLALK